MLAAEADGPPRGAALPVLRQRVLPAVQARILMVRCLSRAGGICRRGWPMATTPSRLPRQSVVRMIACASIAGSGICMYAKATLPQAIPLLERAVALSQEADIPNCLPRHGCPALALAYALAGRATDALAVLGQGGEDRAFPPSRALPSPVGRGISASGSRRRRTGWPSGCSTHARHRKARG